MPRALFARAAIAVLAVASLGLASCGYHHHHPRGTLEIANDPSSTHIIDSVDVDEVGGPDSFTFTALGVAPGESFFVDLFPDTYDITVHWDDLTTDAVNNVDVFEDTVTTVTVVN